MKKCGKCRKLKSLDNFYLRKSGPRAGEYYEKCKECMKLRGRTYYHVNRDRQLPLAIKRTKEARVLKRSFLDKFKNKPCADCGKVYPPFVMDFDHRERNDKISEIAHMAGRNWSLENIKKEVEKCDLVCANCHRIRTYANMPS